MTTPQKPEQPQVSVSVSWEADISLPLDELLADDWPEGLPVTAENIVAQLQQTQTGLTYRPSDLVKDADLLDPINIEVYFSVVTEDGRYTHARWAETGNG